MQNFDFFQLLILAFLVESIVQTLKPLWEPGKRTIEFYASLGVSIAIAVGLNVLAGLDMFALLGVPLSVPVVGLIATGILMSRGAGVLHDLIKTVQELRYKISS